MQNKGDVKAMMARFQTSGASADDTSSTPAGRPKQPLHSTLSSGPTIQTKKTVLESLSGSAVNIPPKPNFLKNNPSVKNDTDVHEPNKTKALASRFSNTQDDTDTNTKPFINKQQLPFKPPLSQAPETKGVVQKPLANNKPALSSTLSNSAPVFPKPASAVSKPSWVKEDSGGGTAGSTPPKIPPLQQKPSSSVLKLKQQTEDVPGVNTNTANKPLVPKPTLKPTSNFKAAQNMFNKEMDKAEQPEPSSGVKADGVNKLSLTVTNSIVPPVPPISKKPSLKKPPKPSPPAGDVNSDASSGPKRNPLPNSLALGPAPAKPNRPPHVNLENIKRGVEAPDDAPGTLKKHIVPSPSTHSSNHGNPSPPAQPPPVPSLPPGHPGSMIQQEEFYDDVDELISSPPPLPPSAGHPSQRPKDDSDDGEMYEDLDERWEAAEQKQDKSKLEKEEKKRLEAEKKELKEREKKEQEAKKKFKLVGPLEIIHQGKARVDCRGSKTDLALKQGDSLDIIRVQGNPEGKWLGRAQDGSIGYVKTTSVEIDFQTLKNRKVQQTYDPEVYDDIDVAASDNSGVKAPGVVLPPLPGEEGEIYDDVVDPNLEVSHVDSRPCPPAKALNLLRMFDWSRRALSVKVVPPPSQFTADGTADQPVPAIDEEIYDDVDSQNLPPLPPLSSLPTLKGKSKSEEMDPKKQKKFEKEEKEFRKKFKYEGEIQVLYQVTIVSTLTNKKWSGKDLAVKAGEKLDVIVKAVDGKLVCRNEEGKFGNVSTNNIAMDDGDIYDDIGDDCIYDND